MRVILVVLSVILLSAIILIPIFGYNDITRQESIQKNIEKLGTRNWDQAMAELVEIGNVTVKPLLNALKDPNTNYWVRARTVYVLSEFSSEEIEKIFLTLLQDTKTHIQIKFSIVETLGRMKIKECHV
ncbi:MAG: HEAT repeat domain-containing protein, partial [Acidobacteria bacterium]|nr:HEAT repeat domain-containing protein [Acidobacteriota bacterium]